MEIYDRDCNHFVHTKFTMFTFNTIDRNDADGLMDYECQTLIDNTIECLLPLYWISG